MVMGPVEIGTKYHSVGEGQQQFSSQSVSNELRDYSFLSADLNYFKCGAMKIY
jgi:hypothetical protein